VAMKEGVCLAEDHEPRHETSTGVSWMHRFASLVAVMAFLLMLTGALVSGASGTPVIFQWTRFFSRPGSIPGPPVKYAAPYQGVAAAVIILTLILALWLWRSDSHRYIKSLAGITVGVLLVVAVVASVAAHFLLSAAGPFLYAFGIQVFFSLAVCLALFTRTDWRWDHPKTADLAAPSLRQVLVFMTGALFLLSLLGEGFRRKELGIAPHLVLGIVVTLCAVWVLEMAISKFQHLRPFKMAAILLAELVGLQLFLGIISYSFALEARAASGPHPGLLVMNVTHAAVGALVLAASLFVTFQAFKYLRPEKSAIVLTGQQED
jgi:heme A synthase